MALEKAYSHPDEVVRSKMGLGILAFPCNQFGNQEPGSKGEIKEFARQRGARFLVMGA